LRHRDRGVHPFKKQDTKKLEEKKENENSLCPFPNLFQKNGCLHWLQNNS
jgi:hypothetical protein